MKKVLRTFLILFALLFIVLLARTFLVKSRQLQVPAVEKIALNSDLLVNHFVGALKIQTISYDEPSRLNHAEFKRFHDYLREIFPLAHSQLSVESVSQYSLLFRWEGADASLAPVVVMAHFDVVPVEDTPWKHPPFGGQIAGGYIWGRGTLDDKSNVLSQLEAVEHSLQNGFKPKRTIYFAFGHDEEAGGRGAAAIVQVLEARGIKPDMVLDEGSAILEEMIPGVLSPAAMIGTSEKGYVTVQLSMKGTGGHSSAPPPHTIIGELSRAVERLEENPMPGRLEGSAAQMLDYLGPELPFVSRFFVVNRWLFNPLLVFGFSKLRAGNAMVRTTTAVTMFNGGVKENVLPSHATATVNFRIRPGETVKDVTNHIRKTIANEKIKISERPNAMNPSPVSSLEAQQFEMLHRTIKQLYPSVIVVPGVVIGATDARHYTRICNNVYRFSPYRVTMEDFRGVHGTDERIQVQNYLDMIRFYVQFLHNAAQ
ncbi:M20 family peptidase [bacterium]|nr:M20 family peptidase [bacterium]MCI0605763.1 M20 family peptidase [bacterium]